MLAGWDPVPLGGGIYLKDMRPGAENRLLPGGVGRQMRPLSGEYIAKNRKKKEKYFP